MKLPPCGASRGVRTLHFFTSVLHLLVYFLLIFDTKNMEPKRVSIIHHHLHPGGVTRIIDSQVKSLASQYPGLKIRVICGNCDDTSRYREQGVEVLVHEDLNYLYDENPPADKISGVTSRLMQYIKEITEENEILHVHNLNLGKNPLVTYAFYQLAREGHPLINHSHDFAEDRPANMAFLEYILRDGLGTDPETVMYPGKTDNYHFAVINTLDQQRLLKKGIPLDRVTYLPNPVSMPNTNKLPSKPDCRDEITRILNINPHQKIITYPVRVIRRKNIGELILLSELFRDQAVFLITLAPKNPIELEHYKKWRSFCRENELNNVHFEVGEAIDFPTLVKGSDFCITTSIREGFGMTYMEPWLYQTPVIGRKIDYITHDFINKGLIFKGLYEKINLPGLETDFKDLDTKDQMYEILRVSHQPDRKKEIFENNSELRYFLDPVDEDTIDANINRIMQHFSLESYGKKIMDTYQRLLESAARS